MIMKIVLNMHDAKNIAGKLKKIIFESDWLNFSKICFQSCREFDVFFETDAKFCGSI